MFLKFLMTRKDVATEVSIFEGFALHLRQPEHRIGVGIREMSPHPKEGEDLSDFKIITLERKGDESLGFLINLNDVGDEKIIVFLMNEKGETIERIYG